MMVDCVAMTGFEKGLPSGGPFVFGDVSQMCGHNSGTVVGCPIPAPERFFEDFARNGVIHQKMFPLASTDPIARRIVSSGNRSRKLAEVTGWASAGSTWVVIGNGSIG
jgi:hypothetical protein